MYINLRKYHNVTVVFHAGVVASPLMLGRYVGGLAFAAALLAQ
jgi:hypothetical protein